jgi:hypothetical protein
MHIRLVLFYLGILLVIFLAIPAGAEQPFDTPTMPAPTVPRTAKWVHIDCSLSPLSLPHQVRCSRGPLSAADTLGSRCTFENWSARLASDTQFGFVRLMKVSPDSPGRCYIYHRAEPIDLMKKSVRDAETLTRDWSAPTPVKDGFDSAFVNANNSQCRAFTRDSRPWQGGYLYVMRGFLCGKHGATVGENDLAGLLAAVTIRGTDTMGNIEPNR